MTSKITNRNLEANLILTTMKNFSGQNSGEEYDGFMFEYILEILDDPEKVDFTGRHEYVNLRNNRDWEIFVQFWKKYKGK